MKKKELEPLPPIPKEEWGLGPFFESPEEWGKEKRHDQYDKWVFSGIAIYACLWILVYTFLIIQSLKMTGK